MLALSAAVCLALMVAAGRQSPVLLAVLFCAWVLSPFLGLALCSRAAVRLMRRAGVDASIAALSIASAAFYALIAVRPPPTARALPYLVAPAVAWLLVGVIAARIRSAHDRS
jgi:hypothetical protein